MPCCAHARRRIDFDKDASPMASSSESGLSVSIPRLLPSNDSDRHADAKRVRVNGCRFAIGRERFRVDGVTYGPFEPDRNADQFPDRPTVRRDFQQMKSLGITAVRTYHVPPEWLVDAAAENEIRVFLDVPWPKHICFLDNRSARQAARNAVARAAAMSAKNPAVMAVSVCNEVAPDIVRWYGHRRVERFLGELVTLAKQA